MDIYLAPHGSGLQQGGGPRPLRHKGGGGQPRIHVPAGIKGNIQGILYQENKFQSVLAELCMNIRG